jgi:hypothetical protein
MTLEKTAVATLFGSQVWGGHRHRHDDSCAAHRYGRVKRLFIVLALSVRLGGCGLAVGQDVRAYNICLSRHPHDTVVCEGPREAYELDPSVVQLRSVASHPRRVTAIKQRGPPCPMFLHLPPLIQAECRPSLVPKGGSTEHGARPIC